MMTFEDFVEKLIKAYPNGLYERSRKYPTQWKAIDNFSQAGKETFILGEEVRTGGMTGGICFDNGEPEYCESEHGHVVFDPDSILEVICPNISYLRARKLVKSIESKIEQRTEREYYGNTSEYRRWVVNVYDLYNAFKENELLQ